MTTSSLALRCPACGARTGDDAWGPTPFGCSGARAGDGRDHVPVYAPSPRRGLPAVGEGESPFVVYRDRLRAHRVAMARGEGDQAFCERVLGLDRAVAAVWGHGFVATPTRAAPALASAVGAASLWAKDETCQVGGSHKARHLFGVALQLGEGDVGPLAIASCGNAALAAAVVARAMGRPLAVYVPSDANGRVLEALSSLGADVHICTRMHGVVGDPCVAAFREALARGAVPFCCQGSDDALTIEGCRTLAYELATQAPPLDRLFVQVGGGALASAVAQGLADAVACGVWPRVPAICPVQTEGAAPLQRAHGRVASRLCDGAGIDRSRGERWVAQAIAALPPPQIDEAVDEAARRRAEHMWPWETEPRSVAHGILDDETYDWVEVVRGTLKSGGWPVVVDEATLLEAAALSKGHAAFEPDETGASGLAGALWAGRRWGLAGERVGVLLTGRRR